MNGADAVVGFTCTNGAQVFSKDGTLYTNTLSTSSIPSRKTALSIGNDNCCGNTHYFNGRIYELLAIKLNLSAAERIVVEGYLAWKFTLTSNLPAGHKYKAAAP